MKIAEPDNPVRVSWLAEQSLRLDARPYVSHAYAARAFLRRLPRTDLLERVTTRIFHPGRVRRQWTTDPSQGVPFLGSADVFEADLSWLPLMTATAFAENSDLALQPGWTLITRSGMTAGRVTRVRPSMVGYACSEDVLRVAPNPTEIPPGYLYAFLASRFGVPVIRGGIYGTSVRHIEPHHIADLPVPRLGEETETGIHELIEQAAELRERFQRGIVTATRDLFESAGLANLLDAEWHSLSRATGFTVWDSGPLSLRASNYDYRSRKFIAQLASVRHRTLGEICKGGQLRSGVRFRRVDADPVHGVRLVGQREGFWLRPDGRWINAEQAPSAIFAEDETVMVASQGLPGENSLICRATFVTGSWLKHAYSEHFLRIASGTPDFPGAYLFAFLQSKVAFRVLRSMLVGTGPQDIHPELRATLPVPECTPGDRRRIAGTVRAAFRARDEADKNEDLAMALLEEAVREAAR